MCDQSVYRSYFNIQEFLFSFTVTLIGQFDNVSLTFLCVSKKED